jgi:hypothetical protein
MKDYTELRAEYRRLYAELQLIEHKRTPPSYLVDELIDRENTTASLECTPEYWQQMIGSLIEAANIRANEQNIDLPAHLTN